MIFFFYGTNSYASRQKLREMMATYLQKTGGDLGLERIDGEETDLETIRAAIQAAPFLSSSRLIIVEYLSRNKAAAERIELLIRDVPATTVLVFYEQAVDKRTNFYKTLLKEAKAVAFEPLSQPRLAAWVAVEAKRQGAEIERPALDELVERCGDDQWRLSGELAKLAAYSSAIRLADVQEMVEAGEQQTIFELVDAMTAGRTRQALKALHGLLAAQTSEIYILTMIIWQLRNLLLAKTLGSHDPGRLAKDAGLSPYVASKALSKQNQYQLSDLTAAFQAAVEADYQIKSGQGKPEVLLEALVYRLSS